MMKKYWIGVIKTLALFVWSFGATCVFDLIGKPYSKDMFAFSVLTIMIFILSVSHYSKDKE